MMSDTEWEKMAARLNRGIDCEDEAMLHDAIARATKAEAERDELQRRCDRLASGEEIESDRLTAQDDRLIEALAAVDMLRAEVKRLRATLQDVHQMLLMQGIQPCGHRDFDWLTTLMTKIRGALDDEAES